MQGQRSGCAVSKQRSLMLAGSKYLGRILKSRVWPCAPSFCQSAAWDFLIQRSCLMAYVEPIYLFGFWNTYVSRPCSICSSELHCPVLHETLFLCIEIWPDTCSFCCVPSSCSLERCSYNSFLICHLHNTYYPRFITPPCSDTMITSLFDKIKFFPWAVAVADPSLPKLPVPAWCYNVVWLLSLLGSLLRLLHSSEERGAVWICNGNAFCGLTSFHNVSLFDCSWALSYFQGTIWAVTKIPFLGENSLQLHPSASLQATLVQKLVLQAYHLQCSLSNITGDLTSFQKRVQFLLHLKRSCN